MGYLETGMRVLDSASALLSRLQELAVLGANDTNTTADHEAINLEAEAIGDEFNRLMTTSTYKGRDVFNTTAGSLYVSMGGRDQEMTFGIGRITYTDLYQTTDVAQAAAVRSAVATTAGTTTTAGPNEGVKFHLAHLPSDAVVAKEYGKAIKTGLTGAGGGVDMEANKTYIIDVVANSELAYNGADTTIGGSIQAAASVYRDDNTDNVALTGAVSQEAEDVVVVGGTAIGKAELDATIRFTEVNASTTAFLAGHEYEIVSFGSGQTTTASKTVNTATFKDVDAIGKASSDISNTQVLEAGTKFTVNKDASIAQLAALNALTEGMTFRMSSDTLTKDIEAMQGLVNTARVQAGSQYAAIESAVNYTTDLTAQYELGYNTVNDVNFSMETAHLAKNQILQQAATAMLAQANQGQQGLLQLIS
jgi:flagellin